MCDANGCGASYFPQWLRSALNNLYEDACNEHDIAYGKGGSFKDRWLADVRFLWAMLKRNASCVFMALLTTIAVVPFYLCVRLC